jgi:hypothetical protein
MTTLIYCAASSKRFAEIALRYGFEYGAQLPNAVSHAPYFVDQDWRNPVRHKYMKSLEQWRPALATVLDWEREDQFDEVMSWAEEAAGHVTESVIIIPKVPGGIKRIPRLVNGKPIRLGYSASSTFSSTPVGLDEFAGWGVHCLGGTVRTQRWVSRFVDVQSADGNYTARMARMGQAFVPGFPARNHSWPKLREIGIYQRTDAIYIAFELTCLAVEMMWNGATTPVIRDAQFEWIKSNGHSAMRQLAMF